MLPTPASGRVPAAEELATGDVRLTVAEAGDRTPEQDEADKQRDADQAIIDECTRRFKLSDEAESILRGDMREDRRFQFGDHWFAKVKSDREADGRPCLTINKIPQYINQVTNQQRIARPATQIGPVDDKSDPDTARIFQGIVRLIERDSRADLAYDHACQDQVSIGRGWWQITAEFDENDSLTAQMFVQDLKIRRVPDPFCLYRDPTAKEPDYSDGRFLVELSDIPRDTFESQFGEDVAKELAQFTLSGSIPDGWLSKDIVRVAKYWRVVTDRQRVYLGKDGKVLPEPALAAALPPNTTPEAAFGDQIVSARWVERRKVEWFLLTAAQILDRGKWPGKYIPYIPVLGSELWIEGRVDLRGIVRDSRDPSRRFDYMVTAESESIGLAPKAPFIGYKGQFTDPKWKDANVRNYPYLESDLMDINGERVPLPQRNVYEPPIRAISEGIRQADSDLRVTTGYYDQHPNEGVGSERSGRAILARQRQGEIGNSHFIDNLARAIVFTGRQLIDLIPHYYDTFRILRILGEDGKPEPVGVYAGNKNKPEGQTTLPPGLQHVKDLSVGKYDVTIKMGKSYQSAREEKQDALTALAQAAPQMIPQIADVWIGSYDWDGAQEIAQRLKPPGMGEKDPETGEPIPAGVQRKLQMLMQQHEQLAQALTQANDTLKTKKMELESRERIAKMQVDAQIGIAAMQSDTTKSGLEMKKQTDTLRAMIEADYMDHDQQRADTEALATMASLAPPTTPATGTQGAPSPMPMSTPSSGQSPSGGPAAPLGA